MCSITIPLHAALTDDGSQMTGGETTTHYKETSLLPDIITFYENPSRHGDTNVNSTMGRKPYKAAFTAVVRLITSQLFCRFSRPLGEIVLWSVGRVLETDRVGTKQDFSER
ncbi:hypothetical protein RRG08_024864 [Elysia crispata]|uniref:Uncharacterized protein n=1 Tax=Elysia crispata TaxID=231223 RepID=A0AAE0YJ18_9GAST|nr:hypothetical protein RRG08_024864 [Elysia crispata]